MKTSEERLCLYCGKPLRGRADKRYCNDYCRNSFNNQLNSDDNNYVRNINNILRKNRRILKTYIDAQTQNNVVTTHKDKLLLEGFNFNYFTHLYVTQKQQTYHFVYEYGYLLLAEDKVLIVKNKK